MHKARVYGAYALCLLGFLISVLSFYPGYLNIDAVVQLSQAKAFIFLNWHPPIMALVWHGLLKLLPWLAPAAPMLLLQLLILWGALALWVYLSSSKTRRYLWLLPLIGFFPSVIIYNGVIWKDMQMGNSLLLAFALTFLWQQNKVRCLWGRVLLIGSILFLSFYAFCLRYEAFFACLPLFYLWTQLIFPRLRLIYKFLLSAYIFLLFMMVSFSLNWVLSPVNLYPEQQIMFYDLAGLSLQEHVLLLPLDDCTDQGHCLQKVEAAYQRDLVDPLMNPKVLFLKLDPQAYQELKHAWISAILAHPFLYLRDRALFFKDILFYQPLFYHAIAQNPFNLQPPNARAASIFLAYSHLAQPFNLLFWLLLNLVGLLYLRRQRAKKPGFSFFSGFCVLQLSSGLWFTLSHFIVAAAPDFRYYYWTMLSTLVSGVLILLNLRRDLQKEANGPRS